ncbi:nucleotidyltransferase domain-containing protein [Actinoplanes philippinensis]|uniref:nucleotidyltransferase domain-containing protein n=1 Tax=Actinoplanes philippinensis TaxID=35752 RepID=UPI001944C456|nr:nucleotidyltransferase domain-containing protein [Actinoplanes philippinensis]
MSGLHRDGTIAREGRLDRVPAVFGPVVEAARVEVTSAFGAHRLHSAYLYGSIPRGTAIPGVSDLDVLLAFRDEPGDADHARARAVEDALDQRFEQINGVGILLCGTRKLLSDLERHDLGFFVACLCTSWIGDDLAAHLPSYRPTSLLARETNGDLDAALVRWSHQAAEATTSTDAEVLTRGIGRRLVRTGFTLIMPRWGGWTSDLGQEAALFGDYYPHRAAQMTIAADVARRPSADLSVAGMLIDDLGRWLADEYTAVHGKKAPRP